MEQERYTVYVHVDESINVYSDGSYTWNEAFKRMHELLKTVHSVTVDGIRYYPEVNRVSLPQGGDGTRFAG